MPFNRTQLRRLAAYVLLGWVLAFGVSVAHACGLAPGPVDHNDVVNTAHANAALSFGVAAPADTDHVPPADHPSCVKFCEDSSKSATSSGNIAVSVPAHLNSVPLLRLQPNEAACSLCAAWRLDQGQRPPRELAIELQRLTL